MTISYQKSLISTTGAAEFAKRFRVRGLSVDLSPISIRSLCNFYHPYGLMAIGSKYGHKARFSTLARVGGAGYKVLSRLDSRRSIRFERLYAMRTKNPLGHECLELWLGRGLPLNPYIRGFIINYLRKEMKPKDIRMIRDELFFTPKVKEFLEWLMLRSWMKMWLNYCLWYYGTAPRCPH